MIFQKIHAASETLQRLYIQRFNAMCRNAGLAMLLTSIAFGAWGFYFLLNPESPKEGGPVYFYFAVSGFTLFLGIAFLRVKRSDRI